MHMPIFGHTFMANLAEVFVSSGDKFWAWSPLAPLFSYFFEGFTSVGTALTASKFNQKVGPLGVVTMGTHIP